LQDAVTTALHPPRDAAALRSQKQGCKLFPGKARGIGASPKSTALSTNGGLPAEGQQLGCGILRQQLCEPGALTGAVKGAARILRISLISLI